MAEKILIVEDELTLQETLAYNLKHQGCEVETTNNSQVMLIMKRQAVRMYFSNAYILINR